MFSFLGKLPASDSGRFSLNSLDYTKVLRLAVVVFVGAFAAKIGSVELSDSNLSSSLLDALNAGIAAISAAAIELLRRFLTNQG